MNNSKKVNNKNNKKYENNKSNKSNKSKKQKINEDLKKLNIADVIYYTSICLVDSIKG